MRSTPQRSAASAAAKARMPVSTLMISRIPCCGRPLDHLVAHAVAFADAVRHVELDLAAAELDRGLEDDDGGGAVHVVVAVDKDGLAALDGGSQALDGGTQSGHEIRRVEMCERGREEFAGPVAGSRYRGQPAASQSTGRVRLRESDARYRGGSDSRRCQRT